MHTDSFGTMDGTYFVSRGELIHWVNSTFRQNISKIEELSTGAIFCQIFNECMPNKLQFSKVNWSAKQDYEFINNFKILQLGFTKSNIKKNIEIEKLVKGKCQDNLEMLQWMKKFFDSNFSGVVQCEKQRKVTPNPRSKILVDRNSGEKVRERSIDKLRKSEVDRSSGDRGRERSIDKLRKSEMSPISKVKLHESVVMDKNKIAMDALQKERDFYFEKLREIELQVHQFTDQSHPLVKKLQGILYLEEI